MKIDSHQHFWEFDKVVDPSWINDDMSILRRDYLPSDVQPLMQKNGIAGCVAVQADQTEDETHFLLDLASRYDMVKGVVGWVDFRSAQIKERLDYFAGYKLLKGFRHIVQAEKEDDFLLRDDFCRGIALLQDYSFTYDILIYPEHLKYAHEFVKRFPVQKFIIDHIAKPYIKEGLVGEWKKDLQVFGRYENVYCKIAGLVTEADWKAWQIADFTPYVSTVLDIFGTDRVIFGSDWPVCLPSASYDQVCDIVEKTTSFLSGEEKEKLWGTNAIRFYNL